MDPFHLLPIRFVRFDSVPWTLLRPWLYLQLSFFSLTMFKDFKRGSRISDLNYSTNKIVLIHSPCLDFLYLLAHPKRFEKPRGSSSDLTGGGYRYTIVRDDDCCIRHELHHYAFGIPIIDIMGSKGFTYEETTKGKQRLVLL